MKKRIYILLSMAIIGVFLTTPIAEASTGIASSSTAKANTVIATAEQYLGTPYLWGGTTFKGIDCSALVQNAFQAGGIALPRVSRMQYNVGKFAPVSGLEPGDIVFFSFLSNHQVSHVGIYIGNGEFINATSHRGVAITKFSSYWWKAYVGAKRVL